MPSKLEVETALMVKSADGAVTNRCADDAVVAEDMHTRVSRVSLDGDVIGSRSIEVVGAPLEVA